MAVTLVTHDDGLNLPVLCKCLECSTSEKTTFCQASEVADFEPVEQWGCIISVEVRCPKCGGSAVPVDDEDTQELIRILTPRTDD